MIYRLMGRMHMLLARASVDERGQGTVEYVALILLVAVLLAGVVAAARGSKIGDGGIPQAITNEIRKALGTIK